MVKLTRFDNGLRLVTEENSGVRSVSVGFWVGAGSGYENAENNGISHFTEHVMYKGTAEMTAAQIAERFEDLGASMNAFTSKEATCYYFKSIDENLEECFALLSHIFYASTYDDAELDKERKVIMEEINMVEDAPEDICYDRLAECAYRGTGLAQTILGPTENVARFRGDDVRAYLAKMYTPDNVVISMAGNIPHERAEELIAKYVLPVCGKGKCAKTVAPRAVGGGFSKYEKDFEQVNMAFAFPSVPFDHPDSAVQNVVSFCFGMGMSSRLFQVLREQKGLVYNVYTSASAYENNGSFGIYVNTSGKNVAEAVAAVRDEVIKLRSDGLTAEELARAKSQLRSSAIFALENTLSMMNAYGKYTLCTDKVYDFDKRLADIANVTENDVRRFCEKTFDFSKVSAAYVGKAGPLEKTDIYAEFTK